MSRTPLFHLIRRSLRLAQISLRSGIPVDEVVDLWHEDSKISRRLFLGASAISAAGLATTGVRRFQARSSPSGSLPLAAQTAGEVLIIGAGIAGLIAGYRLTQQGVRVRILEAQERTGGRMFSLRDHFPDKQVVELGGELIDSDHQSLRSLAAEMGLSLEDFAQDDSSLARDVWYFSGRRFSEKDVAKAFLPIAAKIAAALKTLTGDTISYKEPNNGQAIDRMSIAEWLDKAGAEGWFRALLDVAYTTEYGLEIDQQSAWNFLMLIDADQPFRVYGKSDERFHVRGGNGQIPAALARKLGDRVQTGTVLEAINLAADGTYRCSVRRGQTSETLSARHVLLAIPFTMLRQVRMGVELPPVKQRAIQELGYGTNSKLMVGFSERHWRTAGDSNGSIMADLPFQTSWEATRMQPGKPGVLVNYTGGRHGVEVGKVTDVLQAKRFATDLEQIFPGIAERRTIQVRFHWPTFHYSQGSYSAYLPGQWTGFSGAEGERVGNLHFAGEHCSANFQGFMEGACETGERAAVEILADLGIKERQEEKKVA